MTDQETQETELEVVRRRRAAAAFILITASLSVAFRRAIVRDAPAVGQAASYRERGGCRADIAANQARRGSRRAHAGGSTGSPTGQTS